MNFFMIHFRYNINQKPKSMKKIYLLSILFLSIFSYSRSLDLFPSTLKITTSTFHLTNGKLIPWVNPNSGSTYNADFTAANPITSPTAASISICEGSNLTLTANPTGGVAPFTYLWTGPNSFTSTDENPVINNVTASNAGTYSLVIIDANLIPYNQSTDVTVNTKIDPTFDATLPAICNGGLAPVLSTKSTNGITGTWVPSVVSNTTTATYIFTPDAGQCANTLSFTIFVISNVTPVFTLPASICQGATPPELLKTSNNGIVGTWNPETVSNTSPGSYTFTPTLGQCATITTINIAINPLVAVFLPEVAPICSGDILAPLPETSTNGVTGIWSPAINNTATTTYTFTPTSGQCTTTTTSMTIVVNPITSTFDPVTPICSGDVLAALPTTSTNGVTGTWSPALNNTATTTYTFTPTAGQCATTTTPLTIVVNPLIATFDPVASICSGDVLAALPSTSTNGVTGFWFPTLNNTATTTYTFTPTAGQCATSTTSLTIVVNPLIATFDPVAPICSGDVLAALPTTSTNGVTGAWLPALNNTATTTYTFTPTAGQCATTTTDMTIVVNPIIATFDPVAPICSGDVLAALPTTSTNGVTGSWLPALNNTATTTYTFTPTAGQCTTTTTPLTIVVNPLTATFDPVAPICSGDVLAALPTTSTNGVTGSWLPAVNNTATTTYTFTPTAGQCATTTTDMTIVVNPIIATFDPVAPICSGDVLAALPTTSTNGVTGSWLPALNNTATTTYTFTPTAGQCATTTTPLTIVVNPLIATFDPVAPICSGDVLAALPTTSTNGVTGSWLPALNNTATTTYTFTPTAGQCATTTTDMTIVVNPIIATFDPVAPICSGDVLAALPTTSTNGVTGSWSPVLNNTATTAYTFTPTVGQCTTTTTSLTIVVNPKIVPVFDPIASVCYRSSTIPTLPTTSNNGITGTWNPATVSNLASAIYSFTPDAGLCATNATLSINVTIITPSFDPIVSICENAPAPTLPLTSTNGITGIWNPATVSTAAFGIYTYTFIPDAEQCALGNQITITVNPTTALFNPVAPICSGGSLTALPTTSTNGVTGSWTPALNNTQTTTYLFSPDAGQCTTVTTNLTITVNPNVTPTFTAIAPMCSGSTSPVLPPTSNNGITGTWVPTTINNTASGTYTFNPTVGLCALPTTLSVTVYPSPTGIVLTTTDVVNEGPDGIIVINSVTSGVAPFQYSINNGGFTTITTYANLLPGNYTITVKDANGCVYSKVVTINSICLFPNAISPNNDDFNDTFNLKGCNVVKLELFNRYGRKINTFSNYTDQWDGTTSGGDALPDGTYYYTAEIEGGKVNSGWIFLAR
jgi:gliding motility-associated-like protein